jgi:hypothetical protein
MMVANGPAMLDSANRVRTFFCQVTVEFIPYAPGGDRWVERAGSCPFYR